MFPKVAKHITSKAKICNIVSPLKKSPVKRHKWTYEEERAIVEYMGIARTDPNYGVESATEWPSFREDHCFWTDAASHIKTSTSANILFSSMFIVSKISRFHLFLY